jgi:hypothetical protein
MKLQNKSAEYAVYCWDGWQRGHLGEFNRQATAVSEAKREAKTGLLGDIYYVERKPDRALIAEFEAGCV